MTDDGHFASEEIQQKIEELQDRWKQLKDKAMQRKQDLEDSLQPSSTLLMPMRLNHG